MLTLLWFWLGLTLVTGIVWLIRHIQLSKAARVMPPLDSSMYPGKPASTPTVSFLVAAKDEEANIEACLRSMAEQDYPQLELIAVNDRSTDQTGQIMQRIAAETGRLTALNVTAIRDGWFGKNNAMREGVERARGEWLCFTDADCVQVSRRSLSIAMSYALEKNADFLSVLPAHETGSFMESVIQPACSGIMMIWFNPLRVNNPRRKTAYANGAFMLMKRSCYEAIGGHDAVKTELNEDMHMARIAKERGLRLCVVSNVDLYTVRMYDGFKQTIAGWSRIFFGCFGTLGRLLATGAAVFVFSLAPWISLAAAAALAPGASGEMAGPLSSVLWASIAICLLQWSVMFRFYRLNRLNPAYAIAYPIGAAVGLYAVYGAIRRLGGKRAITWRGTTYRSNRLDTVQAETRLEQPVG